jgi:glycosyltransferase involved in cell wall biosynthesis
MQKISCSLCISTYNRPSALSLCLESVLTQSVLPDEIIIGDDGSAEETKQLIEKFIGASPVPVIHIWHPDDGFRLSAIRNKSFAKATGEYIIQIDGDVILHKHFVKDHMRLARRGTFVCGGRSLLTEETTNEIIRNKIYTGVNLFSAKLSKKYNAVRSILLSRLYYLFQRGKHQYQYVLGANMAFWRKDLLLINGYNESFKGWGKEDNELAIRLCNAGVTIRFIKFAGIIYHLHHTEASRDNIQQNEKLLQESIHNNFTFVQKGVSSYLH